MINSGRPSRTGPKGGCGERDARGGAVRPAPRDQDLRPSGGSRQGGQRERGIYAEAEADPLAFWASQAKQLTWDTPWTEVLEWNLPFAKWFVGGKLNVAVNCVDRHVAAGLGDRVAFHWEGEPGDTRTITYADLLSMVCQAANGLTELGVGRATRSPSTCR